MLSTADIAIVVAGVVGPGLGYLAAWRADIRRFRHERTLKASEDLVERLDEVSAALETLTEAAVALRSEVIVSGTTKPEDLWQRVRVTEDAYQTARASIARLQVRAHADDALCSAAKHAAEAFLSPARTARTALIKAPMKYQVAEDLEAIGKIPEMIESAYAATSKYRGEARRTLTVVLGTDSRSSTWRRLRRSRA